MDVPPSDTSAEASEIQFAVWRKMGGAARLRSALSSSDEVRRIAAAGFRARRPELSELEAERAVLRLTLGDELYDAAFGD